MSLVQAASSRQSSAGAGGTCGEVDEAQVGVHDGLVTNGHEGHPGSLRLSGGGLHLPNQQQHLVGAGTTTA